MRLRLALAVMLAVPLGSCSYVYDVLAVVIGGRLAFVVDPASDRKPKCINGIHVSTDEAARATPARGDDAALVKNGGAFWWESLAHECLNPFPVFYGADLKGDGLHYLDGAPSSVVEAKPLHVGVVYEVGTTSGATGYGSGRFRITSDKRVENLGLR